MATIAPTFSPDYKGTYLYRNYFSSSVQHEYDTRIDEYNWYMIFGSQFVLYIALNWAFRKFLPPPGKYEDFKARKKIRDYHAYYF
jgi:p-aminobenzoyl-glutamate transporter AbgT